MKPDLARTNATPNQGAEHPIIVRLGWSYPLCKMDDAVRADSNEKINAYLDGVIDGGYLAEIKKGIEFASFTPFCEHELFAAVDAQIARLNHAYRLKTKSKEPFLSPMERVATGTPDVGYLHYVYIDGKSVCVGQLALYLAGAIDPATSRKAPAEPWGYDLKSWKVQFWLGIGPKLTAGGPTLHS